MCKSTLSSIVFLYIWSCYKTLSESQRFLQRGYSGDFSNLQTFNGHVFHMDDKSPWMTSLNEFAEKKNQESQPNGSSENFLFSRVRVHGNEFLVKVHQSLSSISFIQQYGSNVYSKSLFLTAPSSIDLEQVFVSTMDTLFVKNQGIL